MRKERLIENFVNPRPLCGEEPEGEKRGTGGGLLLSSTKEGTENKGVKLFKGKNGMPYI